MPPRRNPKPKAGSVQARIPLVRWKDLTKVELLDVHGVSAVAYSGFLRQPEGHYVHVFIKQPKEGSAKAALALRHEARVLLKLRGVHGIPALYGVTRRPRIALVTAYTSATVLGDFLRPETPRSYLAGVLQVCHIVREVHARGVAHKNLYPCHVFMETSVAMDSNLVMVSLAGFGRGVLRASLKDKQYDVNSLASMAMEVHEHILSSHALYRRRDLLQGAMRQDLTLRELETVIAKVLYGNRPPNHP